MIEDARKACLRCFGVHMPHVKWIVHQLRKHIWGPARMEMRPSSCSAWIHVFCSDGGALLVRRVCRPRADP